MTISTQTGSEAVDTNELRLENFVDTLRVLALLDQKILDKRYIWKVKGKEFSGYPESSKNCCAEVAEALRKYPAQREAIILAVDGFVAASRGTDRINMSGMADRSEDLWKLWTAAEAKADLWHRVAVLLAESDTQSESDVE